MRWLATCAAATVLALASSGCTTPAGPSPTDPPSPSPSASPTVTATDQPVTLRFGVYGDKAALATYRLLARSYTDAHPHVTIDVVASRSAASAMAGLETSLAAGTGPDVFLADHDAVPALVQARAVQPVNELLEERDVQFGDNYQRIGLEAFSADSALQCMPADVSPLVVYYNKDLLDLRQLQEPGEDPLTGATGWSWEQFTAAATMMSRRGVKGLYLEPALDTLLPLVRSAGAEMMDDVRTPGTLTMSDGDTRAALELILTLARDPQVTPTRRQLARQDALTRFENGRIGMLLGTRALTPRLREAVGLRFDVLPLPRIARFSTLATMTGYCVSATSENTAAAADFLAYAVGTEGARIVTSAGGIMPSNIEVEHSDTFLQPGRDPRSADVFSESVRRAQSTPFVTGWAPLEAALQPMIDRLFYAPVIDLDVLLPRLDARSVTYLSPPTESPSP